MTDVRSKTLLLVENPNDRSLCPVSLFVALAIADNVIPRNFQSACTAQLPWIELVYAKGANNLPVFRQAGNDRKLLMFKAIKPKAMTKLLRAITIRAQMEQIFRTIQEDNLRSREQEHTSKELVNLIRIMAYCCRVSN